MKRRVNGCLMKELKVVIDTNILVSILKGSRVLSPIYNAFKNNRFTLIISHEILEEFAAVLYRPSLKIDPKDVRELFKLIKIKSTRVEPRIRVNACRDNKDNFILELAIEAKANLIVTGDEDLLTLKTFRSIPIIKPKDFIKRLE